MIYIYIYYICACMQTLTINVHLLLVTTVCSLVPSAQPCKGAHGFPAHLWTASSRCLSVPRDWSATKVWNIETSRWNQPKPEHTTNQSFVVSPIIPIQLVGGFNFAEKDVGSSLQMRPKVLGVGVFQNWRPTIHQIDQKMPGQKWFSSRWCNIIIPLYHHFGW